MSHGELQRSTDLADFVQDRLAPLGLSRRSEWGYERFTDIVTALYEGLGAKSVLEVGGGRSPILSETNIRTSGVRYAINDVSSAELARAPAWIDKWCFDIAGSEVPPAALGSFDFIFSKFVLEHVADGRHAYRNMLSLLKPGGVVLAYHPTLFALPFVINRLMPEKLTDAVLRAARPWRNAEGSPKFPAYYSLCRASSGVARTIRTIGYSDVVSIPFYGHIYYSRIPGLAALHRQVSDLIAAADFRPLAAYCFTIARK